MHKRLLLLDSASLYFRAFYGAPPRVAPNGTPTNAVAGFVDMVATVVAGHCPTYLAACWDDDWRPAWRVELISSYKSHRVSADGGEEVPDELSPQVEIIRDVLAATGLAVIGAEHHEADDVIGTLVAQFRGQLAIDVVTGDRDLFQLVSDADQVRVLYTAQTGVKNATVVDEGYLRLKYQVADGDHYRDMSILRGDTSDGLPGVRGVGEKTAAALINQYDTLTGVQAAAQSETSEVTPARRQAIVDARDYLAAAARVVAVASDAPTGVSTVDDLAVPRTFAQPDAVADLSQRYALSGPIARLQAALAESQL